ncbi:WXG superfamily protein probably secreted by type VII secretion system [Rathayibacter iranicus NCPPB 2253 = VKM Ac-1602]|uniref:WXG superfamily protein probably secreted by type VII secretion system n=1 Tax=Rathayibacter iranicus NCPPB 2253 = VKM Ac-1602 TaxID=1328868 RepID=A0ABX5LBX9_9MICO|nr:hypothetical protein [Rathayibacter iranicus NCPPB 2253 = VKM Ac-1602]PWJ63877.1 WXG superfamily protein probably secreted by type VII secretion system [Rathayibacter iranicus NCPPB 2253 = VKM Ac-1602]
MEFSADSWQASSSGLQRSLADRIEALDALLQELESLMGSGNISGQSADAMRAYIRGVHVPIVQSLLVCLSTFQTAIGVYWNGYSQVDTDGNFRACQITYGRRRRSAAAVNVISLRRRPVSAASVNQRSERVRHSPTVGDVGWPKSDE